MNNEQLSMNN